MVEIYLFKICNGRLLNRFVAQRRVWAGRHVTIWLTVLHHLSHRSKSPEAERSLPNGAGGCVCSLLKDSLARGVFVVLCLLRTYNYLMFFSLLTLENLGADILSFLGGGGEQIYFLLSCLCSYYTSFSLCTVSVQSSAYPHCFLESSEGNADILANCALGSKLKS